MASIATRNDAILVAIIAAVLALNDLTAVSGISCQKGYLFPGDAAWTMSKNCSASVCVVYKCSYGENMKGFSSHQDCALSKRACTTTIPEICQSYVRLGRAGTISECQVCTTGNGCNLWQLIRDAEARKKKGKTTMSPKRKTTTVDIDQTDEPETIETEESAKPIEKRTTGGIDRTDELKTIETEEPIHQTDNPSANPTTDNITAEPETIETQKPIEQTAKTSAKPIEKQTTGGIDQTDEPETIETQKPIEQTAETSENPIGNQTTDAKTAKPTTKLIEKNTTVGTALTETPEGTDQTDEPKTNNTDQPISTKTATPKEKSTKTMETSTKTMDTTTETAKDTDLSTDPDNIETEQPVNGTDQPIDTATTRVESSSTTAKFLFGIEFGP